MTSESLPKDSAYLTHFMDGLDFSGLASPEQV